MKLGCSSAYNLIINFKYLINPKDNYYKPILNDIVIPYKTRNSTYTLT